MSPTGKRMIKTTSPSIKLPTAMTGREERKEKEGPEQKSGKQYKRIKNKNFPRRNKLRDRRRRRRTIRN